ncbi:MAG: YidC/Oxa1 family insertase periplasmic-domain containing protein [Pirellulales bacterium]|nr:YidC/Oxa1 family insertase periplasmic-domain containing protein [Pirellulales bacterium]
MERRLIMFFVVSFALMVGYTTLMQKMRGPQAAKNPPVAADRDKKDADKGKAPGEAKKPAEKAVPEKQPLAEKADAEKTVPEKAEKAAEEKKAEEKIAEAAPEPAIPEEWITLGSVDPDGPYRMMVTLTNRGAALARIELSDPTYRDVDIRSGYLGHIVMDPMANAEGCPVQVVGPGTPAEKAGLKVGDLITAAGGEPVKSVEGLKKFLGRTKPSRTIELTIVRGGKEQTLAAALTRYPLEVIRPPYPYEMMPAPEEGPVLLNKNDPLSLLMTMQQIDGETIPDDDKILDELEEKNLSEEEKNRRLLDRELKGVDLRGGVWQTVEADREHVTFAKKLPRHGLEVQKTYRLKKAPEASSKDPNFPAYHLALEIKIVNRSDADHKVAYRLDGPNGLPTEGYWYASKVSRNWGGAGLRDVVVSFDRGTLNMITCPTISGMKKYETWTGQSVSYVGVDAQYFSSVLIPKMEQPLDQWFASSQPLRVGKVDETHTNWTNASFRLIGLPHSLKPGQSLAQEYQLFAGPKKPELIAQYGLNDLVYYGWFGWVSVPMLWILHTFYAIVCNYGVAIILLTVLVRGCMFPLSFKQAVGAQKMAEIQPEMKRIAEKHKKDMEGRNKAMQELYRKHNYNPFSGCLPIFIQLPIFLGLYRSLMVDMELRDAPLISAAVRWCSNLAAPDMMFDWHRFMPTFLENWLGPYFNILPILTIVLFLWQQQKMMPPPTDEQQAMQQKMMKYMMIFMGVMFFKVASGLCIYFIASSLWGLGERQFLPKKKDGQATTGNPPPRKPPASGPNGDGGQSKRKKQRDRK